MTGIHNNSKDGFTLIETLIAVGLFMILVMIAVGGFVQALHTQREVGDLITSQTNVSLSIEQMTREIRTGYLFCHLPSSQDPQENPLAVCGCKVNPDGSWTCSTLDFYNTASENVLYSVESSTLMRSDSADMSGAPEPLTSDGVVVDSLSFRLFGNLEGDGWPPRITILMSVSPNTGDVAVSKTILNYETTVSARQIDCTAAGAC